jgi:hypothetical protein
MFSDMKKFSDMKNAAGFDTAQISKRKEALTVKANTKSQSELAGAKRIPQHNPILKQPAEIKTPGRRLVTTQC